MVSGLVRQLESSGETEVATSTIGGLVMEALRGLDPVAYVRFASVYRDFREAADFQEVLSEIAGEPVPTHAPSGIDRIAFDSPVVETAPLKKH
jgi:transcriptional repressor NrdR